jgi:hypothetical protein
MEIQQILSIAGGNPYHQLTISQPSMIAFPSPSLHFVCYSTRQLGRYCFFQAHLFNLLATRPNSLVPVVWWSESGNDPPQVTRKDPQATHILFAAPRQLGSHIRNVLHKRAGHIGGLATSPPTSTTFSSLNTTNITNK